VETCESFGDETAGLSAVQIGVMRRMFVVRRIDLEPESWEVMINPKVTILDNHQTEYWEGCMSIGTGEDRLFGPVPRAKKAKVEYLDVSGAEHSLEVSDYMAHIVLHELDHLEGKLFLQYIDNPRNIWRGGDLDKYL
ncbi:peptide deformylase, partial [Candidatus Dojkabacteria bacterium]|nr:peptide deformylase [Candidatus Dojkabacteria bacterium]